MLFKYIDDSTVDKFEDLVGNHKVLPVKSLFRNPKPTNLLDWVIRKEFCIMDSVRREVLASHLC
jgi:hypothetical protein